jgi:radical SAM superfamily enzyme YgiQ (UPF0313 family)
MTTRQISFVQPNFQKGPKELQSYYLPYTVGCLWAYAIPNLTESWYLDKIVWRRDPITKLAADLATNDVVAFSTYVWNRCYNYNLAEAIKKINPNCLTIFGGPEPPVNDKNIFRNFPFIDLCVLNEGEVSFAKILNNFDNKDFLDIPGILINQFGQAVTTAPAKRIDNLENLPSPYLTGLFDKLVIEHPEINWVATLETNRGCPFQCTFCDWGSLTYSKVKKFNLERVFLELDWMGRNCEHVTFADANLGIFPERDELIIDHFIEVAHKYNRIKSFSLNWAKNQRNEVVAMVKKLADNMPAGGPGLTVSVQSMDLDVLENIKRKNLDQHKITEIFALCETNNVPVFSEAILGLPGETEESWQAGIYKLFENGNHHGVQMYQAQMLANAEMTLLQKRLYGMKSTPIYDYMTTNNDDIIESIDVVYATKSIPEDKMLDLLVWNVLIETFHIGGITTSVARFLTKYCRITYANFYDQWFKFLVKDSWMSEQLELTKTFYSTWFKHGLVIDAVGTVPITGINLVNRLKMLLHYSGEIDRMFLLLDEFLQKNYQLNDSLREQLIIFSKCMVLQYHQLKETGQVKTFDYDFVSYLRHGDNLHSRITFQFWTNESREMSYQRFLENFHYGKKRNFGVNFVRPKLEQINFDLSPI